MNERIEELIRKKGVSYRKVAEKVGVSPATVGNWVRGDRTPDAITALKLAWYLDVSIKYLLTGEDEGRFLSQTDYKLEAITGAEADEILQSLDVIASLEEDVYKDICDDIFTIGRKLMSKKLYSKK